MKAQELIDKSLDLVGLRGRTMANYTMLSAEIKKILGETVSPITLYRIASPRNEKYKPFRHSIALLEEFISHCKYSDSRFLVNNNHYHSSKNPRGSALYTLLSHLLQSEDWPAVKGLLDQIDTSCSNLGWERYIIAFVFADYLRVVGPAGIKSKCERNILSHPSFSIFYLETFLDYSAHEVYLNAQKIWLQYNPIVTPLQSKIDRHHSLQESWLFAYAVQPFFASFTKNKKRLHDSFQVLLISLSEEKLLQLWSHNPILSARVVGGQMLVSRLLKKDRTYQECVDRLFAVHLEQLNERANSFEKAFGMAILLDTFILCEDRDRFIHLLKQTHRSVYDQTGDASILRVQYYLDLLLGKKALHPHPEDSFFLSDGEFPFHNELLQRAQNWLVK